MNQLLTRMANSFGMSHDSFLNDRFEKINQDLVRYFQNEYGKEWKTALDIHLYKLDKKNDKKAA